ncbi:FecCD family ABC transporter permease [Paenibacillus ehimensis]|uniref:FecCD family ABC transporter permease n=1 Tax=Paenibacillus ehimensis TaxID=79264 RepID=UPI000FD7CF7B|nr:iron ABC transporter permease [Paenibacillus ehimensis]
MNRQHVPVAAGRWRNAGVLGLLSFATLLCAIANIGIGDAKLGIGPILASLVGQGDPNTASIIFDYRLPRIALALLAGAGLAVAGVIAQGVMRNPLAAPDTLGITGGAGLAAVVVTLLFPLSAPFALMAAAFGGGIAAASAVYLLAYRRGIAPVRLALVGVAVSAFCSSGIHLLVSRATPNVNTALIWLSGSLWGRSWDQVLQVLPWMLLLLPLAWLLAVHLDVIRLGDPVALGLGVKVELLRASLLAMAVALTGSAVAVVGTIGFVGLIVPHAARQLVGARHRILIPTAALLGGLLVLVADALGRGLVPPVEVPAGLVVSAVGGPYFLYLLWRQSRR